MKTILSEKDIKAVNPKMMNHGDWENSPEAYKSGYADGKGLIKLYWKSNPAALEQILMKRPSTEYEKGKLAAMLDWKKMLEQDARGLKN